MTAGALLLQALRVAEPQAHGQARQPEYRHGRGSAPRFGALGRRVDGRREASRLPNMAGALGRRVDGRREAGRGMRGWGASWDSSWAGGVPAGAHAHRGREKDYSRTSRGHTLTQAEVRRRAALGRRSYTREWRLTWLGWMLLAAGLSVGSILCAACCRGRRRCVEIGFSNFHPAS